MPQHRQMEPTAESTRLPCGAWAALGVLGLILGCSRPLPADEEDSQSVPDVPADLPEEDTEIEGILYGIDYGAIPTRFISCESGELLEISYPLAPADFVWKGSCYGVYNRVLGHIDRTYNPPRIIIAETLEARWCEPSDCGGDCKPDVDSCYIENEGVLDCDPVLDNLLPNCSPDSKCNPIRFYATETAGWMHDVCTTKLGDGVAGDPCEYPAEPGHVDTCDRGFRCWNPTGDLSQPGTCVPYCDLTGEFGPACDGTCVQCSGSERGLCVSGCSGEDCNVDAFC